MSILPEYVLQQVLVRGIRAFREDHSLVQMLFRNLHQDDVVGLQTFLRDHSIDIVLNYPSEPITVPAIVITLKNETESQGFLGDVLQPPQSVRSLGHPFPMDEAEDPAAVLGGGSITDVGLDTQFIGHPIQASGATSTTITFSLAPPFNISDPFEVNNLQVRIREGTGAGQVRDVLSINPNKPAGVAVIKVGRAWTTLPDSTSIFSLSTEDDLGVQGEPSKLYTSKSIVERIGAHYRVSYQLLISGPNPEMALFLYAIVKAIMFVNAQYLQKSGFLNLKMSGTDFVSKPEYFPDLAYSRALIMEFEHSFDVYLEVEAINHLRLDLGVYDPDVGDNSGVERVVSSVEFDL
jgi:hypothetical protein